MFAFIKTIPSLAVVGVRADGLVPGNHQQHNIRLVSISSHSLPYLLLVVGVANPALPTAQNTQQRLAVSFGLMNKYQQRQKRHSYDAVFRSITPRYNRGRIEEASSDPIIFTFLI